MKHKIGLVYFAPEEGADVCMKGLFDGLKEQGIEERVNLEVRRAHAQAEIANIPQLIQNYDNSDIDVIVAMTTPVLTAAAAMARSKPVVFTYVYDPIAAGAGKSRTDHLPHVTGVSSFPPVQDTVDMIQRLVPGIRSDGPQTLLTICGMPPAGKSLEGVFRVQMAEEFFPVPLPQLRANIQFCELTGPLHIGDAQISAIPVNHPGEATAYRLEYKGRSVVYVTDHEPYCRLNGENAENSRLERDLAHFARSADLYIREAQYTDEEYKQRRGWGHGTYSDALAAARDAAAQTMLIMHHDPLHDDDNLDRLLNDCRADAEKMGLNTKLDFAYEGLELYL